MTSPLATPLLAELRELIAAEGPIDVARYMALALGHPRYGYYMTRDPLGAGGDFTTAPEISQMFGEMIGLWVAETWRLMGEPGTVRLVELGPGRGTLMADALRAARAVPGFRDAIDVHLVETSPVLSGIQRTTLATCGRPVAWHARVEDVPGGPAIVIANEFLDALPIRQFERREKGWHERLVGLGPDGALVLGLAPDPEPALPPGGDPGSVLEVGEAAGAVAQLLAERLVREGGAALFVDYGHDRPGYGDTLQAVRRHAFADPLANPGEADLTAHVDLAALGRVAVQAGALAHGTVTQGAFLSDLGIAVRAERLRRAAGPDGGSTIDAALARLVESDQMGRLFKVMALSHPDLAALPGLQPSQEFRPC